MREEAQEEDFAVRWQKMYEDLCGSTGSSTKSEEISSSVELKKMITLVLLHQFGFFI